MTMTSKERMLTALDRGVPDRLPVTTHHLMDYFLDKYLDGMSHQGFFDHFGMDAYRWLAPPTKPDPAKGQYYDPLQGEPGFLGSRRISSDQWRIYPEEVPGQKFKTTRYKFVTPAGEMSMVLASDVYSTWVIEPLVKKKSDIELIAAYATTATLDVDAVNKAVDEMEDRGLVRAWLPLFDVFGQPGCWQDACCLAGTQNMILATYDDPQWVHGLLAILLQQKKGFILSYAGARYGLLELGGGDASTTVISPTLFEEFVAPYDSQIIAWAHKAGQRISYHTCGGMMPILEQIAAMGPDAMETFTPPEMGGDVDLAEAKRRIGDRVAMIGGFDQFHFLTNSTPEKTRAEVRRIFEVAGQGGGYILSPSDHFFDADPELIEAFADEARRCTY